MKREGGFSLLELLVAFAIMGLALGMLYRATGSSARTVGDTAHYQQALVFAESLAGLRESIPEGGWNESGRNGIFAWEIRSAPFPTPLSESQPLAAKLHEVVFRVSWGDGERTRQVEVATLLPQHAGAGIPGAGR